MALLVCLLNRRCYLSILQSLWGRIDEQIAPMLACVAAYLLGPDKYWTGLSSTMGWFWVGLGWGKVGDACVCVWGEP